MAASAALKVEDRSGTRRLVFHGVLNAAGVAQLWRPAMAALQPGKAMIFDLGGLSGCDMAGAAMLAAIARRQGEDPALEGASEAVAALFARARALPPAPKPAVRRHDPLGGILSGRCVALASGIAFLGEAVVASLRLPARWRQFPRTDLLRHADQAGVRSVPLVLMMGFLMGLILAFQSAIPMHQFGADLFVANLVTVSLLRELGPLLSALVLAGRTGSAFAAEIGTMKVNEEVDALRTMGIDAMTMLVLPRMLAALLVMPAMTLLLDVAGLLGMSTVMRGLGFPMAAILIQARAAATAGDLLGGLFKAVCYGAVVAAIGCRAGLATGSGPRAVGLSATRAVVGGIVATILMDGVFALIFYRMGW